MIYLYVLPTCPFCNKAIATLEQHNIPFQKVIVPDNKKDLYKRKHKHYNRKLSS